jgi:hypothetical protein
MSGCTGTSVVSTPENRLLPLLPQVHYRLLDGHRRRDTPHLGSVQRKALDCEVTVYEADVRRDVFDGLKRRLGVDVGQPEEESENPAAAETVRDQRAKGWELMHVHGQCSADVGKRSGIRKRMRMWQSCVDRRLADNWVVVNANGEMENALALELRK